MKVIQTIYVEKDNLLDEWINAYTDTEYGNSSTSLDFRRGSHHKLLQHPKSVLRALLFDHAQKHENLMG